MAKDKDITSDDLMAIESVLEFIHKNKITNYSFLVNTGLKQEKKDLLHITIKYREFFVDFFGGSHQSKINTELKNITKEVKNIAWNTNK